MRSNTEKYSADIIAVSNMTSGRSQKKAFFFFPPGRTGVVPPWLAVTLKFHVPLKVLFPEEDGSSVQEISLVSPL